MVLQQKKIVIGTCLTWLEQHLLLLTRPFLAGKSGIQANNYTRLQNMRLTPYVFRKVKKIRLWLNQVSESVSMMQKIPWGQNDPKMRSQGWIDTTGLGRQRRDTHLRNALGA
jgi:hypothetical protein